MSDVKRYNISGLHPHIYEKKDGFIVYYEDYARLKAELTDRKDEADRLKAEVERLRASSFVTAVPVEEYEKLKAEVERLTKLCQATSPDGFIHIRDINAAKEGKPSV